MEFSQMQEIEEEENNPTNLNGHSKKSSMSLKSIKQQSKNDQNEGGEFLNNDGYFGDGSYLSTSNCNIQADESDDFDDACDFSFRSDAGLIVGNKPSEDKSPVKVESFQKLSSNEIISARIRK